MRPANRDQLLQHIRAHPVEGSLEQKRQAFHQRLLPPDGLGTPARLGQSQGLLFGGSLDDFPEGLGCIFLHGGGYVLGSPASHAVLADHLARDLGRSVYSISYPAAPERTWPAPLEEILELVDALPIRVALAGGSSGGHLALNVALRRPNAFSALALFSPNTDRTGLSNTREANTPLDAMNSDEGDREFYEIAMPDTLPEHPDASPLLADLSNLPSTFISATEGEVLLGDTLLLLRALKGAGVDHQSCIASYDEAGMHMFESWPDVLPAGAEALRRAANFLSAHA